jgi:hypothetical protein
VVARAAESVSRMHAFLASAVARAFAALIAAPLYIGRLRNRSRR